MKIIYKTISLFIIIVILLNLTACSNKVHASNVSADSIINDASNNAQTIDKIESANISIDFSFSPTTNNIITGACKLDTFIDTARSRLAINLNKNNTPSENVIYLDQSSLIFSLDKTSYSKFNLSTISSAAPTINTILNIYKTISTSDSSSPSVNNPKDDSQASSGLFTGSNFQNILQTILNISNSLTLYGTKKIEGHEMYVLKASINNDSINSILKASSSSANIPTDISNKLTSVDGLDIELYISASGENIVGLYVNLTNIVSTFFNNQTPQANYVQLLFSLNTANDFQIPESKEFSISDIISIISDLSDQTGESSGIVDAIMDNLNINSILDLINLKDIESIIDIKEVVASVIENYVYN